MDFDELHRKLSPTIKRIAYKLNGRYRSFNHDDLYQEASVELWKKFTAGQLNDKTDSYILQGCYFYLKNYIRKVNERPVVSIDAALDTDEEATMGDVLGLHWSCPDCREELNNKLLVKSIQNNGFNRREKQLLKYCSLGLNTRDIGKHLGVSHVSVIKLMQKIRVKARKHLDK